MPRPATDIQVAEEQDTAHGWRHTVHVTRGELETEHTVTLSFQDYELWSGGSVPPATVTKRLVELLLSGRIELAPSPLPGSFDAARARRWGGVDEVLTAAVD
ncbi:MAG: hypothetical protein AAGF47_05070 [Planctomycetota bacterium]